MPERPILFSAPMVRAILAGTKTQTRRVVRKQFAADAIVAEVAAETPEGWQTTGHSGLWWDDGGACYDDAVRCPYGIPGDRLWVRETWGLFKKTPDRHVHACMRGDRRGDGFEPHYRATDTWEIPSGAWRPSIHMPRWASRILLEVTAVRVERLQAISEADALAEGVTDQRSIVLRADGSEIRGPVAEYAVLWESINGSGSWDDNPWTWVITFKRAA